MTFLLGSYSKLIGLTIRELDTLAFKVDSHYNYQFALNLSQKSKKWLDYQFGLHILIQLNYKEKFARMWRLNVETLSCFLNTNTLFRILT